MPNQFLNFLMIFFDNLFSTIETNLIDLEKTLLKEIEEVQKKLKSKGETPSVLFENMKLIDYPFTGTITESSNVDLTVKEAKIKELKALYANKNGIQMTLKSINPALESTSATGIEGTHT